MDPVIYFLYRWALGREAEGVVGSDGHATMVHRSRKLKNAIQRESAVWGTTNTGQVLYTSEVNKFLRKYLVK